MKKLTDEQRKTLDLWAEWRERWIKTRHKAIMEEIDAVMSDANRAMFFGIYDETGDVKLAAHSIGETVERAKSWVAMRERRMRRKEALENAG